MKSSPKNVKLCPTCGKKKDIDEFGDFPQFKFKEKKQDTTKQISIISKTKLNKKLKTLF